METRERALLQESGIYEYTHPLEDAFAHKDRLDQLRLRFKEMNKADRRAVSAAQEERGRDQFSTIFTS